MKENQTRILQAHRVSKCVRGSENYKELTSEEIGGWLKRSRTLLCKNYQLYDIWYYRKHFGITGETNWVISRFIQWEKTWGTDSPNATDSRRVSQNYTKKCLEIGHKCALWNDLEVSDIGQSLWGYFLRQKVSKTKKSSMFHGIPRRQKSKRMLKTFY